MGCGGSKGAVVDSGSASVHSLNYKPPKPAQPSARATGRQHPNGHGKPGKQGKPTANGQETVG